MAWPTSYRYLMVHVPVSFWERTLRIKKLKRFNRLNRLKTQVRLSRCALLSKVVSLLYNESGGINFLSINTCSTQSSPSSLLLTSVHSIHLWCNMFSDLWPLASSHARKKHSTTLSTSLLRRSFKSFEYFPPGQRISIILRHPCSFCSASTWSVQQSYRKGFERGEADRISSRSACSTQVDWIFCLVGSCVLC